MLIHTYLVNSSLNWTISSDPQIADADPSIKSREQKINYSQLLLQVAESIILVFWLSAQTKLIWIADSHLSNKDLSCNNVG